MTIWRTCTYALRFGLLIGLVAGCGGGSGGSESEGSDASSNVDSGSGGIDSGATGSGELTVSGDTCEGQEFTACGGDDLDGTWVFDGGCVTPEELPNYPDCGAEIDVVIDADGQFTLNDDGTFTQNAPAYFDATLDAIVPKTCLDDGETCTDNPIDDDGVDNGDTCQLSYGHDLLLGGQGGSWTADAEAGTLELTNSGGYPEGQFEYCIEGDALTLRRTDVSYHEGRVTLTRQ